MKRLRRWIWNGLAALSVLLCAAFIAIRIASRHMCLEFGFDRPERNGLNVGEIYATTPRDNIYVAYLRYTKPIPSLYRHHLNFAKDEACDADWSGSHFLGTNFSSGFAVFNSFGGRFGSDSDTASAGAPPFITGNLFGLTIPIYYIVSLTLILPGFWLTRHIHTMHREGKSSCFVCSYGLRATPNRCPECGTIPQK